MPRNERHGELLNLELCTFWMCHSIFRTALAAVVSIGLYYGQRLRPAAILAKLHVMWKLAFTHKMCYGAQSFAVRENSGSFNFLAALGTTSCNYIKYFKTSRAQESKNIIKVVGRRPPAYFPCQHTHKGTRLQASTEIGTEADIWGLEALSYAKSSLQDLFGVYFLGTLEC